MQIKLTNQEIKEQKQYVVKYTELINKELSYGDLMNIENITRYAKVIKNANNLISQGFVNI